MKRTFDVAKIIVLTAALTIGVSYLQAAWQVPTGAPPNQNVAAPVNTSGATQGKTGNLLLSFLQSSRNYFGDFSVAGNLVLDNLASTQLITRIVGSNTLPSGANAGVINSNLAVLTTDTPAPGVGGVIGLGGRSATDSGIRLLGAVRGGKESAADFDGYLGFYTFGGGMTERMRISSKGNVGIRNTTPDTLTAPNTESGNLNVNDVYLRSTGRWVSQLGTNTNYCYAQVTHRWTTPFCDKGYYLKANVKVTEGNWDGYGGVCCYLGSGVDSRMEANKAAFVSHVAAQGSTQIILNSIGRTFNEIVGACRNTSGALFTWPSSFPKTCPSTDFFP